MLAAEVAPFAKVGGLGDVTGSLPPALKKLKVDVRLVMPLYGLINRAKYGLKKIYSGLEVPSGRLLLKINIWQGKLPGTSVPVYFIDCPEYFQDKAVYLDTDNSERFLFFTLAALYALPAIKFQPQIVHLQDSHSALGADIIKTTNFEWLKDIKTLYTIHNFRYQGKSKPLVLSTGNLHADSLKSLSVDVADGDVNFTVQALLNADIINTVSPTYAREITSTTYGAGLEKIAQQRRHDLYGILNGIDTKRFNPAKDELIPQNYSIRSINKKKINKIALQKAAGLPINENMPVCGLVSRLVWQKGLDLFGSKLSRLKCQFVILGTGNPESEKMVADLADKFPDQFSALLKFDLKLAQLVYAGSDIFMMPSRFEPCGLGQMIAMRYGTVPVVRLTGGLKDTVLPSLGFGFDKYSKTAYFNALKTALDEYYEDPRQWQSRMLRCMQTDFSWDKSAQEYVKLYKKLV